MMANSMIVDGECYSYTGVCLNYLQITAMEYGIPTTSGSVVVKNNPRANDPNALINQLTTSAFVPDDCAREGLPLVCNYFYLICDSSGNSPVMLSNLEDECIEVSQGSCRSVWQLAMSSDLLPDCSDLDSDSGESLSRIPTSNVTCHPQFGLRCGLCVPLCNEFSETPEDIQKSIDLFFVISGCVIVIGGIFVILVSIIRRSVM